MAVDARPRGADGVVIGAESIALDAAGPRGVLIVHGFNDTPQSVRELARAFHAAGWTVRAPRLAHHGTTEEEFVTRGRADEWVAQIRTEWAALQARCPEAVLVGQSMGGALALIVGNESPPKALVLLAPFLSLSWRARWLSYGWPVVQLFSPRLRGNPERSLRDPAAREQNLGGRYFSPRTVAELRRVVDGAVRVMGAVHVPTMFVHSREDYRVPSRSALRRFARLGASDKTLVWRDGVGHVVAADRGRDELFRVVQEWLASRVPA